MGSRLYQSDCDDVLEQRAYDMVLTQLLDVVAAARSSRSKIELGGTAIEILRSEDALASALLIWQELTEAPKSAWTAKAPGDASIPYYSRIQGFDFRASTSIPSARLGREALLLRKEQLGH